MIEKFDRLFKTKEAIEDAINNYFIAETDDPNVLKELERVYDQSDLIGVERDRYKAALQKMVDSSNNMGRGIYLSSQSCIAIAKEALNEL